MAEIALLEKVLKRDRWIVLAGLVVVTSVSWLYLALMAAEMGSMTSMAQPRLEPWGPLDWVFMFVMWVVMMVAMMLPSATPMILLYAQMDRKARVEDHPFASTGLFVTGYLLVWSGFSLVATLLQWALERAALLSPMMVSTSSTLGGVLLIAAGIYQLTPLKDACLVHCRSPIHFIMHHWKTGPLGALRMGIEHGLFCVGCCWFLMGLLFVFGVMNLLWIAAIGAFVLIEKLFPFGKIVAKTSGVVFLLAGSWFLAADLFGFHARL